MPLHEAEIIHFQPNWTLKQFLPDKCLDSCETTLWRKHNASMLPPHMPDMHGIKLLRHGRTNTGLMGNSEQTVRLSLATTTCNWVASQYESRTCCLVFHIIKKKKIKHAKHLEEQPKHKTKFAWVWTVYLCIISSCHVSIYVSYVTA